jgi:hypothetical protein
MHILMRIKIKKYEKLCKKNYLLCNEKIIANILHTINYYNLLLFRNYGTNNYQSIM